MDNHKLREAADRFGTPLYVFDLDVVRERVERFRAGFGREVTLTYSMKTNPFLTKAMSEVTDRIEVCSMGEFCICRELGISPDKLYISGVLKIREDLEQILAYGSDRARYTAESPQQLRYLADWAERNGRILRVYPRLTNGSQFGMDEDTITAMIRDRKSTPSVEFAGIHFFSGTQKKRLRKHEKELAMLDAFFARLKDEADFEVPELEYGTGFAVPYFEDEKEQEDLRDPAGLQAFMDLVHGMKWHGDVTIEMGRAYAAECGSYITTALDLKESDGQAICLVDGGIHQINYDGQIKGMYRPPITVIGAADTEDANAGTDERSWMLCGSLCTMNDVLCRDFPGVIREGDRIVFGRAGAYSVYEGMSLFLSHELPGVVLYGEAEGFIPVRTQVQTFPMNLAKYD